MKTKIVKTQIVTKLKLWKNSNCDKTQIRTKLGLWQNSSCDKTEIGTQPKLGQNKNGDKTQIVVTQTVTKLKMKHFEREREKDFLSDGVVQL